MSEDSGQYWTGSTDDSGEFFCVGAPLHAVRPGYVRRSADDALYETLVSGGYAHIVAPDRSGKSSLIAATSARLQNNGFRVAVIDLAQIGERDGGTDAGRWYYSIAYRLLRQLRLKTDLQAWWQDKAFLGNRQRLVEFYVEVILQNITERIVVFVDEIQCIEVLPFAGQLLASIRAAHNARSTEPEFSRLSFVLAGECDPAELIADATMSPFPISRPIDLNDFTRRDLDLFSSELNLPAADAKVALDRIFYWTSGQPYLSQKLARTVSREQLTGDIEASVDRIAMQQLGGRAALHNEPHMSHIHRRVTRDKKNAEAQLNLYGRLRKGVATEADLGSQAQRALIAVGLVVMGDDGMLTVRNRLYESVFTARWANDNLPIHWRGPAIAMGVILTFIAIPFLYTQVLPRPYINKMSSPAAPLEDVAGAHWSLRSFPGHADSADRLMRVVLQNRALLAEDRDAIVQIEEAARSLPDAGDFPDNLIAEFWDRRVSKALREENRDDALLAAIESLAVSTSLRRRRAASLIGDDYTRLIGTHRGLAADHVAFSPDQMLLSYVAGPQVSQWSLANQRLTPRDPWTLSALEVTPLVRRVAVDRGGRVDRVGLSINVSHPRLDDLRVKLIAPSGRTVELTFSQAQSSANEVIRFKRSDLSALVGEALNGTWSLSVRDDNMGAYGHLVGWNLSLNSQVLVETFERGLDIPKPVPRDSDDLWFSPDGRYAIARAMQSDSARLWDLALAQPARTLAVPANERVLGLSTNARYLLTIAGEAVNVWNTSTGKRHGELPVGAGSSQMQVSEQGDYLLVRRHGGTDNVFELWSIDTLSVRSRLEVAGTVALIAMDPGGSRLAVADYERTVRVWDIVERTAVAQLDFWAQPSAISLAAGGNVLGVVHGDQGVSLWRVDQPERPLMFERGKDNWQLAFSRSGSKVIAGSRRRGFQVFRTRDGAMSGSPLGAGPVRDANNMLAFSADEEFVVTGDRSGRLRFWSVPSTPASADDGVAAGASQGHRLWRQSGDSVTAISPGGDYLAIGDSVGHVHILHVDADAEELAAATDELSFLGHSDAVAVLSFSTDGRLVASAALDRSIRIWDTASGLPRPFHLRASPSPISEIEFSPSSARLAAIGGNQLWVISADTGSLLADVDLGGPYTTMVFASEDRLYVGGENGALQAVASDRTGSWNFRSAWQGPAAIRKLAMSPNREHLVIVDSNNVAQLLNAVTGKVGSAALALPDTVNEVLFSPGESRTLFRTTRWIHRAGVSPAGFVWLDAVRAPKALAGSSMVFDRGAPDDRGIAIGEGVILLTREAGFPEVAELRFDYASGPALFGNKDNLLSEWRARLGVSADPAEDLEPIS